MKGRASTRRPGQAEPADLGRPTRRRDVGPAHGLRCYLDHAMPGHRVCVLSEDCPAYTGTPVSSPASRVHRRHLLPSCRLRNSPPSVNLQVSEPHVAGPLGVSRVRVYIRNAWAGAGDSR
jgi:hypothetical protein